MNTMAVMDKGAGMVGSLSGQAVQLPIRRPPVWHLETL